MRFGTACLLLAPLCWAAALQTQSIVTDRVEWSSFLSRHDPLWSWSRSNATESGWDYLPTSWITGPFTGNGVVGQVMYFCDPPPNDGGSRGGHCWHGNSTSDAELRIELGRQDLYSARKPSDTFWTGIRLPVGYVRVKTVGKLLAGQLRMSLSEGEVSGNLSTSAGGAELRVYTHANQPVTVLDVNATGGEEDGITFIFQPLTKCVDRWDVAGLVPCSLRPNPQMECTIKDGATTCLQRMDTAEGDTGSFSTIVQTVSSGNGRYTVYMTVASSLWPHDVTADPRPLAQGVISAALTAGPTALLESHHTWWAQFWPQSFLSLGATRVEGFYWIEMYKIASSSREDGPMKDEIGPWYVDTEWPGYWYDLNSELTYWPIAASNRLQLGENLGKQLKLNVDNGHLNDNTKEFNDTETMGIGASSNQMHAGGGPSMLAWITSQMWNLCQYQYNATCHIAYVLPELRGVSKSFDYILKFDLNGTQTDTLHTPSAGLPNCGGGGWDNGFQIGAAHWALNTYVKMCDDVSARVAPFATPGDYDAQTAAALCNFLPRAKWILQRLAPLQIDPVTGINAAWKTPFTEPCRHFDHLLNCIGEQFGDVQRESETCLNTVDQFYTVTWKGGADCTFSYPPVSQMSAANGRGDAAWGNITELLDNVELFMPNTMDLSLIHISEPTRPY
eukprot:TRINITY_DN32694_c0_g1_i3.p1 TRINITY_DN32694_c0_g1~~TRINITY_DN32694_c0_g1_i3.p1  ORF type:complete len:674 (+),score=108.60 TRINITY_DN32694_c0_g1_i3:3-2024(+)